MEGGGRENRHYRPWAGAPLAGSESSYFVQGIAVGLVQLMLKGRLRGYGVGLVQLMQDWPCREFPCPDVFARYLLELALEDFRETAHHYMMHLVSKRDGARQDGNVEEIAAVDTQIHEHTIHEQIPQRWHLDFLFSQAGYRLLGDGLLPFWASSLIEICTLEQYWEGVLLGLRPQNPALLAGFHADRVFDTGWLQDAKRTWSEELRLPLEPVEIEEEFRGYCQTEPGVAADDAWVH